jgi:hypothetical protein
MELKPHRIFPRASASLKRCEWALACRPVRCDVMKFTRSQKQLAVEAKVRPSGHGVLCGVMYRLWLNCQTACGHALFARNLTFAGVDWG